MNVYIMRARGKTYLAIGDDCMQAANMVPAPTAEISVMGGVPADKAGAFEANTEYGGILLLDKYGKSLDGFPVRER